jgi:hypothetical protein
VTKHRAGSDIRRDYSPLRRLYKPSFAFENDFVEIEHNFCVAFVRIVLVVMLPILSLQIRAEDHYSES